VFYKERLYLDKNRKINNVFVTGASGTGKTTFVKEFCKKQGLTYCVSSSNNDPFQDYKGEDILILDDLTDRTFEYNDLLKILDRHTRSTVKSRYHNKFFIGERIFITSTRPIDYWYMEQPVESKIQLKRRIEEYYEITKDIVRRFEWNHELLKYKEANTYVNPVKNMFITENNTSVVDRMGLEKVKQEEGDPFQVFRDMSI
jgi:adenylate kinase family enzyme